MASNNEFAVEVIFFLGNNPRLLPDGKLMKSGTLDHVFILGAGFSLYAGLPLQRDFTSALLSGRGKENGSSELVVRYLRKFVSSAFNHKIDAKSKYWPALEDIFTCVDLSANTGHHLGAKYSPTRLRTTRRALIYRIMTMLQDRFHEAKECKNDPRQRALDQFLGHINVERCAFISTNWDTVVERKLSELHHVGAFDYGCGAVAASLHQGHEKLKVLTSNGKNQASVVKMHGSVNWLYCDNCRQVFWFEPRESMKVAGQLLKKRDWLVIDPKGSHSSFESWLCSRCGGSSLSTRLATFSYLKSLDFPMFQRSWFAAEDLLRRAKTWTFIGYSMPAADYEFKYLLKRVQLSLKDQPKFFVITGGAPKEDGDKEDGDIVRTHRNYQGFFGLAIKRKVNFFEGGLEGSDINKIFS
jgi:NAD-dependent SIR2 family protein deacetylase